MRTKHALALVLPLAAGCGGGSDQGSAPAAPSAASAEGRQPRMQAPEDPLEALRANAASIAARAEQPGVERVRVAHILVSFTGAPKSSVQDRTREQAEVRAAELLERVQKGEDFETLMGTSSDDSFGGIYTLFLQKPEADAYPRGMMVPAFGDVGWRLAVGEVGVAPHDPKLSPFGWHIIKRLE